MTHTSLIESMCPWSCASRRMLQWLAIAWHALLRRVVRDWARPQLFVRMCVKLIRLWRLALRHWSTWSNLRREKYFFHLWAWSRRSRTHLYANHLARQAMEWVGTIRQLTFLLCPPAEVDRQIQPVRRLSDESQLYRQTRCICWRKVVVITAAIHWGHASSRAKFCLRFRQNYWDWSS